MIPLFKVFTPDDILEGINEILHSGQLSYGKYTIAFENSLRNYVGNSNLLTISGNSVLFALKLIGIKSGDEIIASPMGCLATNQPVVYSGAKIVWADIDPNTGTLDPDDVRKKITPKTKAILHYHWGGYPGYIDEINEIAKEKGILVIEDASEAFGAEYKGEKLGNTGSDIVCYSFTPVRLPNSIDGGGLVFADANMYKKALLMRDYGIKRSEFRDSLGEISEVCDVKIAGNGCLMNNISGYMGLKSMCHVSDLLSRQRNNANKWDMELLSRSDIQIFNKRSEIIPSYWVYTLISNDRDNVLNEYRDKGYYASKIHLRNDYYSIFGEMCDLKGVSEFEQKQVCIPSGWWV